MKVLVVSFPGGRSDETWKVGDQASLASLLRGGALAPATTPCERLTNLKVLDSGAYSFVPPEAAQDVSVLHNVTLAFDLMGEGASERVTFDSISTSHLDETLRQVKALGLAETEIDARSRRNLKREFAQLQISAVGPGLGCGAGRPGARHGAVYRPLIGWLSGREHLQVRFIRTLIQKERSFPEASSAVSCSCRRGSPGTAPAGHSMLGFMNGGYVRLSSTPAPSKSTNRTS